jgi:polyphosphate kinase
VIVPERSCVWQALILLHEDAQQQIGLKQLAARDRIAHMAEDEVKDKINRKKYKKALNELQIELVKLQDWIHEKKLRVVVIFEGRDAAGKGGVIKRLTHRLNDRVCRVVALDAPTTREEGQWYFQRYVQQLPTAGEMVLFDRSWYTLAGVERVMQFYPKETINDFYQTCPEFERMLIRSGTKIIKYWFSITPEEQERRFRARLEDPKKRWKLSKMDLASRSRWSEYSKARDKMFEHTNIPEAPWWVVDADDKRRARLNCITHLLSQVAYKEVKGEVVEMPERVPLTKPDPPKIDSANWVPATY